MTAITPVADLTLTKTHAGAFTQGQTGATYTLTVTNNGAGPTTSAVTVTDTLPTGLTATSLSGPGWSCTLGTLTCTRSDALAAGGSYPVITLTVTVAGNAPASVMNTASVSGGGELNAANNTASDVTAIILLPDLTLGKTHAGSFTQGQLGALYTLTVTNSGPGATVGLVTVTDTLPSELTATALSGTGWTCTLGTLTCTRNDALAAGASYSVITLTVSVASAAPASVTNTAAVSGGGETDTTNNAATDVTAITQLPDLTLTKTHTGNFTQGQVGAPYTLTVSNSGAGPTTSAVTVSDTLPTGLTATALSGTGWSCTLTPLSCARSDALAATASYPVITLTVTVASTAPASVTNTASVSGGGETNTANDTATDVTAITPVADLTLTKTHAGAPSSAPLYPLRVSPNGRYLVGQNNVPFLIVGDSPQGLITDLSTTEAAAYFANRAAHGFNAVQIHLIAQENFGGRSDYSTYDGITPFTTPGDISTPRESYFARVDAMLTLAAQHGIVVFLTAAETIDSLDLFVSNGVAKSRAFGQYLGDRYQNFDNIVWVYGNDFQSWRDSTDNAVILAVANGVKDRDSRHLHTAWLDLPVSGSRDSLDWEAVIDLDFAYTYFATYAKVLRQYALFPAKPVFMGEAHYEGENYFGGPGATAEVIRRQEYWAITSGATGSFYGHHDTWAFQPGWQQTYDSPGAVQTLYFRNLFLSRSWWKLVPDPSHQVLTAGYGTYVEFGDLGTSVSSNDYATAALASDSSFMIAYLPSIRTVTVDMSKLSGPVTAQWYDPSNGTYQTIAGSPFSNTGTQQFTPVGNNSDGDGDWVLVLDTAPTAPSFTQGQTGATYTLTVTNGGAGPTAGPVTVTDSLPGGLTATGIIGTGWSCTLGTLTCTRSDELAAAASYPVITLTVSVANDAPASVTNAAAVSGGGEINTANSTASDVTAITITPLPPDLTLAKTHSGTFTQGQTGATYTLTVTNSGAGPTAGLVSVTDTLPNGLTATNLSGVGWSCTLGTLTCTRIDVLAGTTSYPAILLTVDVAGTAPVSVTNTAAVAGGGEINAANNSATDVTTIGVAGGVTGVFQNEILISGMNLPTALQFLPGGDMLILELGGTIWRVPAGTTQVSSTPFLTLTNIGSLNSLQGLMGMVLDPDFANNHYYYVFYTLGSPNRDRVSRFTVTEDHLATVPGSEFVVYQDPQAASADHHGGALNFGNDGKLYITTGENFDPPAAQDLTNPRGKILRINKDGTIPTDNPFYDGAGPNRDDIWALGLRNPFRAFYDSVSGRLYVADVGGNDVVTAQEEVHLGVAGANFGWPNCEGSSCSGNPAYTSPMFAYSHNGRDASITGGFVYRGSQFPSQYYGNYFFADYAQNWIRRLTFDASGNVVGVFNFEPLDGSLDGPYGDIVFLTEGPDGALYYVDLGWSEVSGQIGISKIRRIRFIPNNLPPTVVVAASSTEGPAPLMVNFSSAGSADPEGQPLTYLWSFGDGATSTQANPVHTYTQAGQYSVQLTVSDGEVATSSVPLLIAAGNKPVPNIQSPGDGVLFHGGDIILVSGDATDVEDGDLPASAFSWTIDFLHAGHVHPGLPTAGVKNFIFDIPTAGHDFSGDTRYRITLTVTDSDGLQASQSVVIYPEKVNLSFASVPSGLLITIDGLPHLTPFVYDTLINFTHTIDAPNQILGQNLYTFASWSDVGAQQHIITVPSTATSYTANYVVSLIPFPPGLVAGYRLDEGTGAATADISGNNTTGTLVNAPTWTTGRYGNALGFVGNNYVDLGNPLSLRLTGSMTLSAWINISANPFDDAAIVGKVGAAGWQLKTTADTGVRTAGIQISSNGSDSIQRYGTTVLLPNTWYHIAGVYDAGAQTLNIYVNGVLDNGLLSGTVPAAQVDSSFNVNIAQRAGLPGTYNFQGRIDEAHIFNHALSASEIQIDMVLQR
ncbi:MAG: DUF4038 domain-containing protein [Vicinamibacterales bacterium]